MKAMHASDSNKSRPTANSERGGREDTRGRTMATSPYCSCFEALPGGDLEGLATADVAGLVPLKRMLTYSDGDRPVAIDVTFRSFSGCLDPVMVEGFIEPDTTVRVTGACVFPRTVSIVPARRSSPENEALVRTREDEDGVYAALVDACEVGV